MVNGKEIMQRYLVSVFNKSKDAYQGKCYIDAENMAHAIAKAYRLGGISRDQVDTAKAEVVKL